ncbi:unnamed protein product [Prunus armeniaca]
MGVMPRSPQGSSRVPGNSGRVLSAFDGETASERTTASLDSADFEETEREVLEVSTDSGSTSSVVEVGADGSRPSTSGRRVGEAEGDVSVVDPGEGVLTVKVLAAIGYAPGQFNPNFWITLLRTITTFNIVGEEDPSYEQFAHLYSVTRAKSADQGGWVQSNCLAARQRGHFVVGVPSSQKTWRQHRVLMSGAWESAPGVIVERHIPTSFQTIVSLKRPIATKREIEVIERVRSRISEEGRFHKALLDYKNLYKAGLICELEYVRRKEEEEEKDRQMAGGREMTDAKRKQPSSCPTTTRIPRLTQ